MPDLRADTGQAVDTQDHFPPATPLPRENRTTFLGEKLDFFQVFSASDYNTAIPTFGVVTGTTQQDLAVLHQRLEYLKAIEQRAGLEVAASIIIGKVAKATAGPVFTVSSYPVFFTIRPRGGPGPQPKFISSNIELRGRTVTVNPRGVAVMAVQGVAQLGAIGTSIQYIKANSALDAQQQLIAELEAQVGPFTGTLPGPGEQLEAETASNRQESQVQSDQGTDDGTGLTMPPIWKRDP